MRIAIPSDTGDVDGPVSPVFGRARYFILIDLEDDRIIRTETVENIAWQQRGGAGITAAQLIVDKGANVIISNSIGPRAISVLNTTNIKVYKAIPGSVRDNINAFVNGRLNEEVPSGFGRGFGFGRGWGRRGRGMGRGRGGW